MTALFDTKRAAVLLQSPAISPSERAMLTFVAGNKGRTEYGERERIKQLEASVPQRSIAS